MSRSFMSKAAVLTVAALLAAVVPMTAPGAPTGPSVPVVRIGTVVAAPAPTAAIVWVRMSQDADPVDLPYVQGYVPAAGDQVEVIFHATAGGSMAGLVVGGRSGQSGNLVVNGDFSVGSSITSVVNNPPFMWSRYTASGVAVVTGLAYVLVDYRMFGLMVSPDGVTVGDNYLVSASIPVSPGQTMQGMAAGKIALGTSTVADFYLRVGWFNNAADNYPTIVSETVVGSTLGMVTSQGVFANANVVVPAGVTHARVAIRVAHTGSGASSFYILHLSQVSLYKI